MDALLWKKKSSGNSDLRFNDREGRLMLSDYAAFEIKSLKSFFFFFRDERKRLSQKFTLQLTLTL